MRRYEHLPALAKWSRRDEASRNINCFRPRRGVALSLYKEGPSRLHDRQSPDVATKHLDTLDRPLDAMASFIGISFVQRLAGVIDYSL